MSLTNKFSGFLKRKWCVIDVHLMDKNVTSIVKRFITTLIYSYYVFGCVDVNKILISAFNVRLSAFKYTV